MEELRRESSPFERVGRRNYGYNLLQVEQFLFRAREYYTNPDGEAEAVTSGMVRAMAFDRARGGYEARAVDAAMDRLEDVFAQRERDHLIGEQGEEAWLGRIGAASALLRGRLHRPAGERFRRPAKRNATSYDTADVDALCADLLGYFEHNEPLSVDAVRRAVFGAVRGRAGYEESQVDAYLDRVVDLMAAID